MSWRPEVEEVKEVEGVKEVKERNPRIAAFFDLDGTLVALPSLEWRFFGWLRSRGDISWRNYLWWMAEAVRLVPQGICAIQHANKMYLRGVRVFESDSSVEVAAARHTDGHQAMGQARAPSSGEGLRNPGLPVPEFLQEAVKRVAWHAREGHEIVVVSGTLEPLARRAARALENELAVQGIGVTIRAVATRLEESDGRWTGRIDGEAMFGEAKSRAVEKLAPEMRLGLTRCFAYGDSLHDRWMLEMVGRPVAVNPQSELGKLAQARRWPILHWKEGEHLTERGPARSATSRVYGRAGKKEKAAIAGLSCCGVDPNE